MMKKLISFFLVGCLLFAFCGSYASAEELDVSTIPGDVNQDGIITAADALGVLKFAVTKYVPYPTETPTHKELLLWYNYNVRRMLTDVNNDGMVTSEDALFILQYVVGKVTSFPCTDLTQSVHYASLPPWPGDTD